MSRPDWLDADFLADVATRLAGRDWPAATLAPLVHGAGHGLVSGLGDLLAGLRGLADEDLADIGPAIPPFQETGQ
ncbi:hypothetical protein [Ancylobacter defluvii]|uniref:Uncharacterized protein n=1 Tax=Ancylobacter defluvii TaxID=1282440 RepID=A0A9W6N8Z4_9HYPH|nr:hypothetical protein [Ancylobacter defluvii]MBS7590253.1 hypothetical protein [Ancylobacter defluvii]GLK82899.1 hypothetical protein GCM10017653_09680 [Ancylobacter defluvii]